MQRKCQQTGANRFEALYKTFDANLIRTLKTRHVNESKKERNGVTLDTVYFVLSRVISLKRQPNCVIVHRQV